MKTYTVVAVYEDDFQRFATHVEAESPEEAERKAQAEVAESLGLDEGGEGLIVAGVIEGKHIMVDSEQPKSN